MQRFFQYPLALYLAVLVSLIGAFQTGRVGSYGYPTLFRRPKGQLRTFPCAGYHFAILNTALQYISQDLHFTTEGGGAIVTSALLLGGAIGALSAGQTADIFGLKKAVLFNNILLGLGCLLGAIAQSIFGLTLGELYTQHRAHACGLAFRTQKGHLACRWDTDLQKGCLVCMRCMQPCMVFEGPIGKNKLLCRAGDYRCW